MRGTSFVAGTVVAIGARTLLWGILRAAVEQQDAADEVRAFTMAALAADLGWADRAGVQETRQQSEGRMTPELVTHAGMTVVGIDMTTSNAAERDPDKARIPALWGRFHGESVLSKIPGKKSPVLPVGVYTDYESDHNGQYRLLAGAAVEGVELAADGFGRVTLPAGRYLVFRGEGEMPGAVIQTWMSVLDYFSKPSDHVRAYTADWELYRGPNAVDIYIAVK